VCEQLKQNVLLFKNETKGERERLGLVDKSGWLVNFTLH